MNDMIQIHSGEMSRPRDLIEARVASFSSLKLTQEIKRSTCSKSKWTIWDNGKHKLNCWVEN